MKMKLILKNQNGAAAVEFALIIPLLVLLVAGILDVSLLVYNQQVITNASREGARAGITRAEDEAVTQIVDTYCQDRLITFGSAESPETSFPDDSNVGKVFQADFSVMVTYDYHFLIPAVLNLGITKTLTAETLMRMEMDL